MGVSCTKSSENPKRDFSNQCVHERRAGGGQAGNMAAVCGACEVWREQQPDSGLVGGAVDVHLKYGLALAFKDAALKLSF